MPNHKGKQRNDYHEIQAEITSAGREGEAMGEGPYWEGCIFNLDFHVVIR